MSDFVRYDLSEGIAHVQIDDGKANALSPSLIEGIRGALERAEKEAAAVVLSGRRGRFCAGFDLAVMGQGGDAARDLVGAGAELCLCLLDLQRPVVAACTGHALAAGILVVAACDFRVGARGDFKLGLNEVAIGLTLPHFAREIARERLSKRHFERATLHAEFYAPDAAVDAGFLDAVAELDAVIPVAKDHARRLSQLDPHAFARTKRALRADAVSRIRDRLARDLASALPVAPDTV